MRTASALVETWKQFVLDVLGKTKAATTPNEQIGERARTKLQTYNFEEASTESLVILLSEIQGGVKHRRDSTRVLETKAISIITLASVLVAFAASFKTAAIFTTPLGDLAIALVAVSILFAVFALIPVQPRSRAPHVLDYLDAAYLKETHSRACLLADLIFDWEHYCGELSRILRIRNARLKVSYATILPGLLVALTVAVFLGRTDNGISPSAVCSPGASASPTTSPVSSGQKATSNPSGAKGSQKAAQAKRVSPKPMHT